MKKIVIDAREYPTSTGRYVRKLLEYLEVIDAKSKRQYVVLLKSQDFNSYQPEAKNFTKEISDYKEFTFAEQLPFLRQIRNLKPDLVHFPIVQQPILYFGKTITTINDFTTLRSINPSKNYFIFRFKQLAYLFVNIIAIKKSIKLLTFSEYVKRDAIKTFRANPNKTTVTLLAADKIKASSAPYKKLADSEFLLYVGRGLPHKNLNRLIDAFALMQEKKPQLKLVLVGKRDVLIDRLVEYAKKNNIKNVIATGYVTEGELRWLYENCACYCFPSLSEGFGLPSLEAMIHGAPVASSDATSLVEVNGDAAHYFDPLSVEDMAQKITEVLDDEKLRARLIKKGYKQAAKFSWERMAEQTLEVYKKTLN